MALDLFRVSLGLNIENSDGTDGASVLTGSGAPGADAAEQDDASIGTIFLRQDASSVISAVYQKIAGGNSADDWVQSASKDYVDAAINGLSWREPVLVKDDTAYLDVTAAETAANVGDTVDGVTIVVDDRLLFTNLANQTLDAAQDETAFDGAGSNGIFVGGTGHANSDVITLDDGSTITVDLQVAGVVTEFTVTTGSSSDYSLGATLAQTGTTGSGIGFTLTPETANQTQTAPDINNVYIVSGGTGAWTFTEDTNASTDGDAVLVQDGTCADQQWTYDGTTWILFGSAANNQELQYIRDFIGKDNPGVELPNYSSNNIVVDSTSLETAIGALDAAIGDRTYTEDNFVTDGETITASIDALDQAIGAINSLNTVTVTGVTGAAQTVDSVLVDNVEAVKWFIAVFDEGDLDQKYASEVYATHDGTASGDATQADYNESSKLKINGNITGLDISVTVTGTGAAQVMALQVAAGDTVTVNATRVNVV